MTLREVAGTSGSDALQRAFSRAAGASVIPGNRVELLIDGAATYAAMYAMIDTATHRIHLENYIIHDDECGNAFAKRLIARARAGVTVRVLSTSQPAGTLTLESGGQVHTLSLEAARKLFVSAALEVQVDAALEVRA